MKFSFIVPAKNEQHLIGNSLYSIERACLACNLTQYDYEVIVSNNQSTDHTEHIARKFGGQLNFKVITSKRLSIGEVRNDGARVASGEYFIFVDADSTITPQLLKTTIDNIEFKDSKAGGCKLKLTRSSLLGKLLCWGWNKLAKKNKWFTGSYIYVERNLFFDFGEFHDMFICEDLDFSARINYCAQRLNLKTHYINTAHIFTSDRKLKMFTWKEHFKFWIDFLFHFEKVCKDRKRCFIWYEIRR